MCSTNDLILIQAYIRVKCGQVSGDAFSGRPDLLLKPQIKKRIDKLGHAAEELLYVEDENVLSHLRSLEKRLDE